MKKIILILMLACGVINAKTCYVDSALDATYTKTYDTATQASTGGNQICFKALQSALDSMKIGWYTNAYLRKGTYYSTGAVDSMFKLKYDGTTWEDPDSFFSLQSYPGEWAILDGENKIKTGGLYAVIGFPTERKFWELKRIEIRNGGSGGGTSGTDARGFAGNRGPFKFRYCYIHDNLCATAANIPVGISIHRATRCIVEYCYFKDNGTLIEMNNNAASVLFFGDYKEDSIANNGFAYADYQHTVNNEVKYNLFEGGCVGFWTAKENQYLCGRNFEAGHGYDDTYKDFGDKIHHNIFKNNGFKAIIITQDFAQVYNNIIDSSVTGVEVGWIESYNYKVCVYNNYIKKCATSGILLKQWESFAATFNPEPMYYCYIYNNILDSCVSTQTSNNEEFSLQVDVSDFVGDLQDSAIFLNNYSYRTSKGSYDPTGDSITYIKNTRYSISTLNNTRPNFVHYLNQYDSENKLMRGDVGVLRYLPYSEHLLSGTTTVLNGGKGGNHPYLSGITIPSYCGAVNPTATDSQWVSIVYRLTGLNSGYLPDTNNLRYQNAWCNVYTVTTYGSDSLKIPVKSTSVTHSVKYILYNRMGVGIDSLSLPPGSSGVLTGRTSVGIVKMITEKL
ncbi:MAG: hypothetical protein JW915_23675 [Chitinispirillaceae bacterium]|nr:hypothetical protein [Chitinispirillaceae bacterium]